MTSDSQNMRNLLNLLEGSTGPVILNEAWVDKLKDKLGLGGKKLGQKERQKLADLLRKEWDVWLGQTDREGTLEDMVRFMTHRIGFKDEDVDGVIQRSGVDTGNDNEEEKKDDEESSDLPDPSKPEPDEEEGRPLPKDLNTKLSDYGEVGKKANESRLVEFDNTETLSDDMVDKMLDISAAIINDEYLYNGPANDRAHAVAQAAQMGLGQRGHNRGRGRSTNYLNVDLDDNIGGAKPKGQYDSAETNRILQQLLGDNYQREVARLAQKVKNSNKVGDFSRKERQIMSLIGIAFLRGRT